jgi:hypothetical protein
MVTRRFLRQCERAKIETRCGSKGGTDLPKRAEDPEKLIPTWWKVELYDYMENMPLLGWIWEFARRHRLLQLGGKPVEAMKPSTAPGRHKVTSATFNETWPVIQHGKMKPVFIQSSVWAKELSTKIRLAELRVDGYEGTDFQMHWEDLAGRDTVLKVDLSRRDTVIRRDFEVVLARLRKEIRREPRRVNPRRGQWRLNRVIEAWDLRQWDVSYKGIEELLHLHQNSVNNALREARDKIDDMGWKKLALNADVT